MATLPHYHSFTIGDWSSDGHGKKETFLFHATHNRVDIRKAYLEACGKLGIALHREDYPNPLNSLFCEYDDSMIHMELVNELEAKGLDLSFFPKEEADEIEEGEYQFMVSSADVFHFFMAMVKFSLPDFDYEEAEEPPSINGYWDKDFNYQFGYGTFWS